MIGTRLRPRIRVADVSAGVVLGVQSVPDGLATGLLAGLNPVAGLNAYMVATFTGALITSSAFMVVQSTGAIAMIVSDVDVLHSGQNIVGALAALSLLTGLVMALSGLLRLGRVLRFVSNAVMVGFMSAVGVNIVLGQLSNLTGYAAPGTNRIARTFNTFTNPSEINWASVAIGATTVLLIVLLERTSVGSLGLVVAVVVTSAIVAAASGLGVATLADLGVGATSLPTLSVPDVGVMAALILPALSIAFVGLVQAAGISATFPNRDGQPGNASRDFVGQGAANLACAFTSGMPVGGSASATALNVAAGAKTRLAPLIAAVVMLLVTLLLGQVVPYVALPALAGLLMLVGIRTVSRTRIGEVWHSGLVQRVVLIATFLLTLVIPLQYAVVIGVTLSFVLYVVDSANRLSVRQRMPDGNGVVVESEPPAFLEPNRVVVLQIYGSLFFASAATIETALPAVTEGSRHSVVVLRLRGHTAMGSTVMRVLRGYGERLAGVGSRLMIVTDDEGVVRQLDRLGVTRVVGTESVYLGDERVGRGTAAAVADAEAWTASAGEAEPN